MLEHLPLEFEFAEAPGEEGIWAYDASRGGGKYTTTS